MIPLQIDGVLEGPLATVVIAGGILALLAGIAGRVWIERRQDPFQPSIETVETDTPPSPDVDEDPTMTESETDRDTLLRSAMERFDQGDFRGTIQAAYMQTRSELADRHGIDAGGTQWDFFERYANSCHDDSVDALAELTEAYERTAFSANTIDRGEAERILAIARTLADPPDEST